MRVITDLSKILSTSLYTMLADIRAYPGSTFREREKRIGISLQSVNNQIIRLKKMDLIEKNKKGKYIFKDHSLIRTEQLKPDKYIKIMDSKVNY